MRVGFAGTPAFAATILAAIVDAGQTIPVCLTQPDRPKGRGMRAAASPVKALADRHAIPVLQPSSLKSAEGRAPLSAIPLDVLVVAAYGLLLPQAVLDWPRHGCINVHASLLPRWRGAAPIQRAIEAGDASTGVTIMQMDGGLDTGPIIASAPVAIDAAETGGSLAQKLAHAGATAIIDVLDRLRREGALTTTPQPREGVSRARKIESDETLIRWTAPAVAIERRLRAFDPEPGSHTWLDGERIKLWRAAIVADRVSRVPGIVVDQSPRGIDVACGEDVLRIVELQPPGGRRMSAAAFLAGRKLGANARFSLEPPAERS